MMNKPAILSGTPAASNEKEELFHWPIVTEEDISAVTAVLRKGNMSGTNITKEFEAKYAAWNGVRHALGACNGTAVMASAIWACGVGAGDEVICPSLTYWASCAAALTFGATVNFAAATGRFIPFCNIDPRALTNSAFAPLEEILAYYRERGCRGIGEVCANLHFPDPLVQNLFAAAEKADRGQPFRPARRAARVVFSVCRSALV